MSENSLLIQQVWTTMSCLARAAKVKNGNLPGCAPVGYLNKRDGDKTWIEIDPILGVLIQKTFKLAADGAFRGEDFTGSADSTQ